MQIDDGHSSINVGPTDGCLSCTAKDYKIDELQKQVIALKLQTH